MNAKSLFACVLIFFTTIAWKKNGVLAQENKWAVLKENVLKGSLQLQAVDLLVVDPTDTNIFYASNGDTGIFKSVDGGVHWEPKNTNLGNLNIIKLVIDPFRPNIIYACTKGGLYRSTNGGDEWRHLEVIKPDTAINALATVEGSMDTLYAAIGTKIYRSRDAGASWIPVPDTVRATKRALVVSRLNPHELYVGTDIGVFKMEDDENSLKVLEPKKRRQLGPIEKQKTNDLVVDRFHTHIIFALFEGPTKTSGVGWAHEDEWAWREMNTGYVKELDFPLLSLSLDPKHPRFLYATNRRGKFFSFKFAFPELGVLDFSSTALPSWETAHFSKSLVTELRKTHSVIWFSKDELKVINPSLLTLDVRTTENENKVKQAILNFGKTFGLEYVVCGASHPVPDSADQMNIFPRIAIIPAETQIYDSKNPIKILRYPDSTSIKIVVEWIYRGIGFQPPTLEPPISQNTISKRSFRKTSVGLGILFGFGVGYSVWSLINDDGDDKIVEQRKKLPLPPPFP